MSLVDCMVLSYVFAQDPEDDTPIIRDFIIDKLEGSQSELDRFDFLLRGLEARAAEAYKLGVALLAGFALLRLELPGNYLFLPRVQQLALLVG